MSNLLIICLNIYLVSLFFLLVVFFALVGLCPSSGLVVFFPRLEPFSVLVCFVLFTTLTLYKLLSRVY